MEAALSAIFCICLETSTTCKHLQAGRLDRSKKRTTPSPEPVAMRGYDGSMASDVSGDAERMELW